MSFDSWKPVLAKFAVKAGFEEVPIEGGAGAPALPADALLWRSSYSQLLVIPLENVAAHDMQDAMALGQEWLDVASMERECRDHKVFDAYLMIVLRTTLPRELFPIARTIELDPIACRKHLVWPVAGNDDEVIWHRILRVTVLGLPTSPTADMTGVPALETSFEANLLRDIKAMTGQRAARQHTQLLLMDETS